MDFFYYDNQFGYNNEASKRRLNKKCLLIFLIFLILLILTVIVIVVLALIPVYLSGNKSKDTGTTTATTTATTATPDTAFLVKLVTGSIIIPGGRLIDTSTIEKAVTIANKLSL